MQRLLFFFFLFSITLTANAVDVSLVDTTQVLKPIKDSLQYPAFVKPDSVLNRVYRIRYIDKDTICYAMMSQVLLADDGIIERKFYEKYPSDSFLYRKVEPVSPLKVGIIQQDRLIVRPDRPDWVIYLLFFILSFFAWIKYRYGKYIDTIIEAFFNGRTINQLIRDDDFFKSRPSVLLFFLTSFVGGLLYYDLVYYFKGDLIAPPFITFLKGTFLVASIIIVKILFLRLIGFIFAINKIIKSYITIIYTVTYFFVFLSLPLLVCYSILPSEYSSFVINLLIILAAGNILLHYIRGSFFVISNFQFPKFYLFIYLCALELSPLLILIKLLS